MGVTLVFPPQWTPLNPHFSLMTLGGHLRELGHSVDLVDLNVAYFRSVLTSTHLQRSLAMARNELEVLNLEALLHTLRGERSDRAGRLAARLVEIERWLGPDRGIAAQVVQEVDAAVAVFRDREAFYDPRKLVRAYQLVDKALELVSLPYFPSRVRLNDFSAPGVPLTRSALVAFAEDPRENPFLAFLQGSLARILRTDPDYVGISINSHTQLYGGLTLARLLRKRGIRAHLGLGGNHFVRIQEAVQKDPGFLEHFADGIIVGEGERPIEALLACLAGDFPMAEVPGLIYRDPEGLTRYTFPPRDLPLESRALPSLDGLPLSSYLCPELVLSTRSSKGCYWKKCTFCDTDYGICADYRSAEALAREVEHLKSCYGVENFCFIDECLRPTFMVQFGEVLRQRGLKLHYYGNGRLETSFTRERLQAMVDSGLTMLMWGLESGSDRIMELINKGIRLERRLDILRASAQAGVWNFAYIFFGFPSETREEGMQTIRLLVDNRDIIHSYGRSIFSLGKHARLAEDSARLGIVQYVADPEELSTTLEYRSVSGNGKAQALELGEICKTMCAEAFGEPLWMYLRFREVIHLYLKEHGFDYVAGFRFTDAEREELHRLFAPQAGPRPLAVVLGADNP
ncbi:MAG: radical SAM protein [Candidatus Eremiobacterota bacterium]